MSSWLTLTMLALLALNPAVFAQTGNGRAYDTCTVPSDCHSNDCTNGSCVPRWQSEGSTCSTEFSDEDCRPDLSCRDSVCTFVVILLPVAAQCREDSQCESNICSVAHGALYCLLAGQGIGEPCYVSRQCAVCRNLTSESGSCSFEADEQARRCLDPNSSGKKGEAETCGSDDECESGICDDHIANDGYQKVCLTSGLPWGVSCDVDRQCADKFCVPQGTPSSTTLTALTCAPAQDRSKLEAGRGSESVIDSSTGGGGSSTTPGGGGGDRSTGGTGPTVAPGGGGSSPTARVSGGTSTRSGTAASGAATSNAAALASDPSGRGCAAAVVWAVLTLVGGLGIA